MRALLGIVGFKHPARDPSILVSKQEETKNDPSSVTRAKPNIPILMRKGELLAENEPRL